MPQPDIREQSQRRMEKDRLHDQRILQEEQQQFVFKISKRAERIAIISMLVSLFTLIFTIYIYFGNQPKKTATINSALAQEITKDAQDKK